MRDTFDRAIDALNDPGRRDEYFEILYDDDVVLHGYSPEPMVGKPAVRAFYQALFHAFPDCRATPEQYLVEGDSLTMRFRFAGTHLGEFQGIPANGRAFDIGGITILRFGEARCVERWSVADFLTMMIQIGAVPAPA